MKKTVYTFDICKAEALKYKHRSDFKYNSPSFYNSACRNKWLNDICAHMIYIQLPNGYWNLERCTEESLKYNTRVSFGDNCPGAYGSAKRNGWLDDLCKNMEPQKKPNGYWTKEKCEEEALKYQYFSDFIKNSPGAVSPSREGGWYEDITKHFKIKGNRYKRFIYAYEFPDNHVYVGLTHNIVQRHNNHLLKGTVFEHINETKCQPELKQLTLYPVEVEEARELESYYLNDYINKGWVKLNKRATGAVGSQYIKWDYENCKKEALKYETFTDFRLGSRSAYNSALKNKWLSDVCSHIKKLRKESGYYTLEKCIEIAKECKSISDILRVSKTACRKIYQNGWAEIVKSHLKKEE
jgi:hypothetical protein|nr:MAG TPA: GIY-YIG nuclease superfamily protein [Caudoviricetes sp.]